MVHAVTLVAIETADGAKFIRPAGATIRYIGREVPLAFLDMPIDGLEALAAQATVLRLAPSGVKELEWVRGVDTALVLRRELERTAVNGYAPRFDGPLGPYGPPYPLLSPPGGALDYGTRYITRQADVVVCNLSKEDPDPEAVPDEQAPLAVATRIASQRMVVTVAAGNHGRISDALETLSPFAELPWTLPVGATVACDGGALAEYSASGLPGGRGPYVVAWQQSRVEPDNPEAIGTSFASARAAGEIAALACWCETLRHATELIRGRHVTGIPLACVIVVDTGPLPEREILHIPALPFGGIDLEALRYLLDALERARIHLPRVSGPALHSMMLARSAEPLPGVEFHKQGHGFVSHETTRRYLERFNGAELLALHAVPAEGVEQASLDVLLADTSTLPLAIDAWRRAMIGIIVDEATGTQAWS